MSVINFQKEIPHELMHALGLEHTFEEKEHPNKEHIFMKSELANFPNILNCFQLIYAIEVFVGQKHTLLSF